MPRQFLKPARKRGIFKRKNPSGARFMPRRHQAWVGQDAPTASDHLMVVGILSTIFAKARLYNPSKERRS